MRRAPIGSGRAAFVETGSLSYSLPLTRCSRLSRTLARFWLAKVDGSIIPRVGKIVALSVAVTSRLALPTS
jgi:hypothetical protein